MANWGPNVDERFQFGAPNAVPTTDFDDTYKCASILRTDQIAVYIKYTKGTETGVQFRIDFATPEASPELASPDFFFNQIKFDYSNNEVSYFNPVLTDTGMYRIPVPLVMTERILRVSVATNGGAVTGTGEIWYTNDNQKSPLASVTIPTSQP